MRRIRRIHKVMPNLGVRKRNFLRESSSIRAQQRLAEVIKNRQNLIVLVALAGHNQNVAILQVGKRRARPQVSRFASRPSTRTVRRARS